MTWRSIHGWRNTPFASGRFDATHQDALASSPVLVSLPCALPLIKHTHCTNPEKIYRRCRYALTADQLRHKDSRRTARALFVQITAQGYRGYSGVTDFVRAWREQGGKAPKAFQFDWSEEGLLVGGLFYKAQVSHMKLCASRAFWLVAYPTQTHEMLFDAHLFFKTAA